jgi:fructose-1,6-bisphosphatase/sedoheptulose 1,7-bisphosphatase-like protein
MVHGDVEGVLTTGDLAEGAVMFSATGVTSGELLKGVCCRHEVAETESIVMRRPRELSDGFHHPPKSCSELRYQYFI